MWTALFWKALTERAIVTAAQAALLVLGADQFNVIAVSWLDVLGFAAGGAVLAVLKGLAANAVTGDGPGLTSAETVGPKHRAADDTSL